MSPTVGTFEYYSSIVNREEYAIYKIYIKSKSESQGTKLKNAAYYCQITLLCESTHSSYLMFLDYFGTETELGII